MAIQSALSLQSVSVYVHVQHNTDAAVTVIHTSHLTVGVSVHTRTPFTAGCFTAVTAVLWARVVWRWVERE